MDVGCTLDIWTEPLTSIAYMSMTMHYIDAAFKHYARTLQVDQFLEVSHIAVTILKTFKHCIIPFMGEFDSMNMPVKEQIRVTTDHASYNYEEDNLPSKFQRNGCVDHLISTCVLFVLDKWTSIVNNKKSKPYYQFYGNAPAMFDMLNNSKALNTCVKRVELNKQLTPKLKQVEATRWIGILIMTNSIDCEFGSHHETLALRHQEQKMDVIDQPLLHELMVLLEHCDIVDDERVVKYKDGVEVKLPPDSKDLVNIKDFIKDQILENFMLTICMRRQPARKDDRDGSALPFTWMAVASTARKRAVISVVLPRRFINNFSSNNGDDNQDDIDGVPNALTLEILVIAELHVYEAYTLSKSEKMMMKETDDETFRTRILLWWKLKASTWLILARATRSILAVSVASAM
ncbi:hypothetical protein AXG93_2550s1510 [Marchantia polymorpha subsp. ruderalis]|uniref:Uncharacterized protein n=1 Tax=Marchantia polymorpha subsp. ruderalis TaxID=1480154 RepID=A0A176VNB5_MARPO|nr:hypothetical protein AXG93_2550s1510 [Marchantia polymorpha subsp. ruderalis]